MVDKGTPEQLGVIVIINHDLHDIDCILCGGGHHFVSKPSILRSKALYDPFGCQYSRKCLAALQRPSRGLSEIMGIMGGFEDFSPISQIRLFA